MTIPQAQAAAHVVALPVFQEAALRLETRAGIARDVLAGFAELQANDPVYETLAPSAFNDDDWYEYDLHSKKLVRVHPADAFHWSPMGVPAPVGHRIVSGLRAKHLGLWRERLGG